MDWVTPRTVLREGWELLPNSELNEEVVKFENPFSMGEEFFA